jgi:hypothetical protein
MEERERREALGTIVKLLRKLRFIMSRGIAIVGRKYSRMMMM